MTVATVRMLARDCNRGPGWNGREEGGGRCVVRCSVRAEGDGVATSEETSSNGIARTGFDTKRR